MLHENHNMTCHTVASQWIRIVEFHFPTFQQSFLVQRTNCQTTKQNCKKNKETSLNLLFVIFPILFDNLRCLSIQIQCLRRPLPFSTICRSNSFNLIYFFAVCCDNDVHVNNIVLQVLNN